MSVITIVGAGMMGSAMCVPALDNGHEVRLVGIHNRESIDSVRATGYHTTLKRKLPDGVKAYHIDGLQEAMEGADLVISDVSSFGVKWFEETVIPLLPDNTPVLSVTKGLESLPDGTLVPFPVAMTARAGRKISITLTTDVAGLECAVAMKNAYALGVALAIGLNEKKHGKGTPEHYNPQAALFEQSTREAMKLMQLMNGNLETLPFFAGDLYVTVFGGRTRRIGVLLGEGHTYAEAREILAGVTLESVAIATLASNAIRKLEDRGLAKTSDFPLLMHIDGIIN